jgi:hypothetical protein
MSKATASRRLRIHDMPFTRGVAECGTVALGDLIPRQLVVLAAAVAILSEPISDASRPVFSQSQPFADAVEQAGAVGIAATGRVDPWLRAAPRESRCGGPAVMCDPLPPSVTISASTSSGQLFQRAPGALRQQPGLVVVDRAVVGEFQEVAISSSPLNIGRPWPGSKMKGMPAARNSRACCSMPSRPSGETMPRLTSRASATLFSCEWSWRRDGRR